MMNDYLTCNQCDWEGQEAEAHLASNDIAYYLVCPCCESEIMEVDGLSVQDLQDLYDESMLPRI